MRAWTWLVSVYPVLTGKEPFKAGSTQTIEPAAVAKKDWPQAGVAKLQAPKSRAPAALPAR